MKESACFSKRHFQCAANRFASFGGTMFGKKQEEVATQSGHKTPN